MQWYLGPLFLKFNVSHLPGADKVDSMETSVVQVKTVRANKTSSLGESLAHTCVVSFVKLVV